ncbi:MAG: hypothetical protein ACLQGP_19595, partial [Isosphaeraceae bacterium]
AAGTDAYNVYHAEGQSGTLLDADVNGDGAVNTKDLTETVAADNHTVGATEPQVFPQFQLFAGPSAMAGQAVAVTQGQVQSLLPAAIAAWQAAGLDAADVRELEGVSVTVGNLGTSILGLEAANVITINQTAAGYNWSANATAGSSPAADDVDLLTVLEHELGHVLGLPDNDQASDLMDIGLGLGVSRAPTAADVAAIPGAPSIAVPPSGSHLAQISGPVSGSMVDAALESITGNSVAPYPIEKSGAPSVTMGPVPGPSSVTRKRDQTPHPSGPYPHRTATTLSSRKGRGMGRSAAVDAGTSRRIRGDSE